MCWELSRSPQSNWPFGTCWVAGLLFAHLGLLVTLGWIVEACGFGACWAAGVLGTAWGYWAAGLEMAVGPVWAVGGCWMLLGATGS